MKEFHAKLGQDGRIVIPVKCRQSLGIKPGDELVIAVYDHEAKLYSLKQAVKQAQAEVGKYAKGKKTLTEDLYKLRKEDYSDD